MPRTSSAQRQKNKPFKGKTSNSSKKTNKVASTKTKPITKANSIKRAKRSRQKLLADMKNKKNIEMTRMAEKN